jgi:hypothetical protein
MLAICVSILVLLAVSYGVNYLLPQFSVLKILAVLGGVFFALTILNSLFNIKAIRDSSFGQRWQYPLAMTFNRLVYNFAARPVLTIQYTSLTGTNMKRYLAGIGVIMVFALIVLIPVISGSRGIYMMQRIYWRYGSDPGQLRTSAYANTLQNSSLLLAPLLEHSDITDNRSVWLFVPLPKRELDILLAQCTQPEIERGDMDDGAYRRQRTERFLGCADQYLDFSLNEQPLAPITYKVFYYPNQGEYGVKVFFENLAVAPGENVITITHGYRNEEDLPRVTYLPFRFLPEREDVSYPTNGKD